MQQKKTIEDSKDNDIAVFERFILFTIIVYFNLYAVM